MKYQKFIFQRTITIFIIFLLIVPCDLWCKKQKQGVDIVVIKKDGSQTMGELYFIDQESLTVKKSESQMGVKINIDDIRIIRYRKKRKTTFGILIGGVVGGSVGAAIPVSGDDTAENLAEGIGKGFAQGLAKLGLIGLFTVIGMVLGGWVGSNVKGMKKVHLDEMSPNERTRFILKLKSRARIKQ